MDKDIFWLQDFSVLLSPAKWLQFWPFDPSLSLTAKYNAASRLVIYSMVAVAAYRKSYHPLWLGALFLGMLALYQRQTTQVHLSQPMINEEKEEEHAVVDAHSEKQLAPQPGYLKNPTPWGVNQTTNAAERPFVPPPDNLVERMYRTIDNIPEGLVTHPVPDQLKNVQHPTFHGEDLESGMRLGVGDSSMFRFLR